MRIGHAGRPGRPAVCVRVRDNGPGVPASHRDAIFEPFFTTRVKGTGLGLAIARRIVEAHDGTIALAAEDGRGGCEIVITLPRDLP